MNLSTHDNVQCAPEKKKPINQVNFSENYNELSQIVYIITNSVYQIHFISGTRYTICIGHTRPITNYFKWWCKIGLRRIGGDNGVCHVSEQRDVLKRHSLAFLLSYLSCFFSLDSLFWHGLASLNLVILTQQHYSAKIDFDMHEFKLFLISHALRYYHVFGIKWKKRKCPW